jgi:hypothetical protein
MKVVCYNIEEKACADYYESHNHICIEYRTYILNLDHQSTQSVPTLGRSGLLDQGFGGNTRRPTTQ